MWRIEVTVQTLEVLRSREEGDRRAELSVVGSDSNCRRLDLCSLLCRLKAGESHKMSVHLTQNLGSFAIIVTRPSNLQKRF
jgi:hypothetical protein